MLKNIVRRALQRKGIQVRREPGLIDFLSTHGIDLVVDVGANEGQFASSLREIGYRGRIVSFEPVESVYALLCERANSDPKWETRQLALGSKAGRQRISVSANSVFSSLLPQLRAAVEFDPAAAVVRSEEIEVVRFDDLFGGWHERKIFLKVDTQGFERQVIQGARASLSAIQGIQLELPVVQLYAGNWSFEGALGEMRELGFEPAQIRPVTKRGDDRSSALEFDCVFRRIERLK